MSTKIHNVICSMICAISLGAVQHVYSHTNKTFMQQRNAALFNLPLEQTTLKERCVTRLDDRFGGILWGSYMRSESIKGKETGSYFGINQKHIIDLTTTLPKNYIINGAAPAAANTTIEISPRSKQKAFIFGYYQDLSKIARGLFLSCKIPLVFIKNSMMFSCNDHDINLFLEGQRIPGQQRLLIGQIIGTHNPQYQYQETSGAADIDLQVGYRFLNKDDYNAQIYLSLIIPTEHKTPNNYFFKPQVGSQHWGLGGGLEAQVMLWGDEDHAVKANYATSYRYFFQSPEERLLGLSDLPWGHYNLINVHGTIAPAANYLLKTVDVARGSMLDMVLSFVYNNYGFTADIGYELYFSEQETVKVPGPIPQYTHAVTGVSHALDATAAETPTQFTHSIYGGIGYTFTDFDTPLTLGAGCKYEYASSNSALDNVSYWIKCAWSF